MTHLRSAALVLGIFLAAPETTVMAQNATPAALTSDYLADMAQVEKKLLDLGEAIPAEQYGWRPGEGVRSISEVLMHVVSENYYWMPSALGSGPPEDLNMGAGREVLANLEKVTDKADVLKHVRESFAYQRSVIAKAEKTLAMGKVSAFGRERSVAALYIIFVADEHEHLGQLIAYARSIGVVPPWSQSAGN